MSTCVQTSDMALLVTAIIGREITMSALREWAASCSQEAHQAVAVSSWGKWKTATQVRLYALPACNKAALPGFFLWALQCACKLWQHPLQEVTAVLPHAVVTALSM